MAHGNLPKMPLRFTNNTKMLKKLRLYISNPEQSLHFYVNVLGMICLSHDKEDSQELITLTFEKNSQQASLELLYEKNNTETTFPRTNNMQEGYWKIALALADIKRARVRIEAKGVTCSECFEVKDVAFLCHLYDPDGYCIELIQHHFVKNAKPTPVDENFALGSKTVFLLVTYRIKELEKSLTFYKEKLNMKLYSVMPVRTRGFDLYFLSSICEKLPNEQDLLALENREWLWQREYTMLEFQHVIDWESTYDTSKKTGFHSLGFNAEERLVKDPDGYNILL